MKEAIGQSLPLALGVALNPFAIIAIVLILVSDRARVNGSLFVVGWLFALGIVGAVFLTIAGAAGASKQSEPAQWVNVVKLLLGAALLFYALQSWRARPVPGAEPRVPKWMAAVDGFGPAKTLGVAIALGVSPKNLIFALAASEQIAERGISGVEQIIAYAVFALVGTLGIAIPLVMYFVLGERSTQPLENIKTWMIQYSSIVVAILCLVLGFVLVGDGIAGI